MAMRGVTMLAVAWRTGGNIYAATVMLAEKAADMIIADHRLRVEGTT